MSTSGTEKHCRLTLMLSKGVTKACHHLLLKRVEELKPSNLQPNEWTLTTLLDSKKQIIIKSNLLKEKFKVLFPETGDTVLSKWDLSLLCEILISYCDLTTFEQMEIKKIRNIRNSLCHMNDAEITNTEFKNTFEDIEVIVGRILEKLGDEDLKIEVNSIIKKLESGPLSLDEVYNFFVMEMDMHGKLDQVLERFDKLDEKYEVIINKLDQIASSRIDGRSNDLVPVINIFLDLKNVTNEEEAQMSDVLQQLFEEVINQDKDFKSSIPPNSYVRLREAVNRTFQLFLSRGWRIIRATHKCIHLQIQCSNFKSLTALFREHTSGQMDNHLTDLNEALTEHVSGGKPRLQSTFYNDEFCNVLDESISSVDRYLSELNINFVKKNDNVQPLKEGRRHTLSFTAQKLRSESSESFEGDCNNEVSSCLQFLKTELESEFNGSSLSIQAHNVAYVNRKMDDTYTDDVVEKLEGQGNIIPTMKSDDVKISKSFTEEKEKEISFKFKDEEEKYDKAAIKQRSLEEIDPTKEAHAKGKYQSREKEEIAKQINWKRFTLTVNNQLCEPFFNNSVTMEIEDEKSPLIKYMKKAVNERNELMEKFTVTYHSGLGYFIEAINDVRQTYSVDKSFWEIRTESGQTHLGISYLIPEHGMDVVVDLVTVASQCNEKKRFSFTVTNQLREPFFNNSVSMEIEDEYCPLIEYMKRAVAEKNGLLEKFTTYFSDFEHKIEAINDAKATPLADNSSWKMRTQFGPVQTGISSFIPKHGMDLVLDLVADQCDEKKCFTFTVKNKLCEPFFNKSVTMEIEDEKSKLITYMKKAVDEKKKAVDEENELMKTFTVTYVPDGEYLLEAINDAKATPLADNSSWKLRTQLGPTQTGTRICSFKPEDGMNVILELNGPDDN